MSAPTSATPPPTSASVATLLPRVSLNTDYVEPGGETITLDPEVLGDDAMTNGSELQEKLYAVPSGGKLIVPSGYIYSPPMSGGFVIPNKGNSAVIYVVTDQYANLPAPGRRVTELDMAKMPTLRGVTADQPILKFATGASNWRFVGINIDIRDDVAVKHSGATITRVIQIGESSPTLDQMSRNITFDRCNLHSHDKCQVRRILSFHGINLAVIDSRVYEGHHPNYDAQAIWSYNGLGPYKIVNNYLSGSGETVFFSASQPSIAGIVPMDIEVRRNHFFRPTTWIPNDRNDNVPRTVDDNIWSLKNGIESKSSGRVLLEGNVFENIVNGDGGQRGHGVVLKDDLGQARNTRDWTVRYNKFIKVASGFSISAFSDTATYTNHGVRRVHAHDNVFAELATQGRAGRFLDIAGANSPGLRMKDLRFEHNTAVIIAPVDNTATAYLGGNDSSGNPNITEGFVFNDNIVGNGAYDIIGDRACYELSDVVISEYEPKTISE